MLVVDNFIPKSMQERYKSWLLGEQFPWFYTPDVTFGNGAQQRPCMTHRLYADGNKVSALDVDYLAHLGAEKLNYKFNSILHGKAILQFPLREDVIGNELDNLHTDIDPHEDHLVVLYYVMDADGDTIICNCVNEGEVNKNLYAKDFNIIKRVTPKQGRVVLFDGRYYHTAEQPKNGMRCVINLNVV
jgi:hypothetical protein